VFRIKRDPAKLLGSAVARSTPPFDGFLLFENVRILFSTLWIICAFGVALGQSPRPSPSPEPTVDYKNANVDPNITSAEIAALPGNVTKPRVTLQRALKIAERYTRQQRIDLSPYFLLEARMIQYGDGQTKEPRWLFHWVTARRSTGGVEITVSMNGRATRLISW
jgi:hypothetical protein